MRDKIDKLGYAVVVEEIQNNGCWYRGDGKTVESQIIKSTYTTLPSTEEIMNKINEIIDILNEESEQE